MELERHSRAWALLPALLLLLGFVSSPAQAGTYSGRDGGDSYCGSGSTTVKLGSHASYTEHIWTTGGSVRGSAGASWPYTIRMYNSSGTQVWSASNQYDRYYTIGSNVTTLKITPNGGYYCVAVWWRRA